MDNNTNPAPVSPSVMVPTPAGVVPNPTVPGVPVPQPAKGGRSKLFLIIGVVVLLLAAGGVYYYLQQSQAKEAEQAPVTQSSEDASITALKKELESLAITEVEADFTAVDKDLNSL